MEALHVEGLQVELHNFTLNNITLDIPQGSVMGLIGRNGAGKTTFIKSILNLLDRKGTVQFQGRSLENDHEEVCRDIAYVGTDLDFSVNTKVKSLAKIYRDFYPVFEEEKFEELCKKSNITLKSKLSQLSLGQNKLLQLYLAICRKPKFLILDEPMANLDPITRREIIELLSEFMINEQHSILISSHLLSDLEKIADYVTLIDQGHVVLKDDMVNLQDAYFEVFATKEELTKLPKDVMIHVRKQHDEYQALCHVQNEQQLEGYHYQRADLETIMYYCCEKK